MDEPRIERIFWIRECPLPMTEAEPFRQMVIGGDALVLNSAIGSWSSMMLDSYRDWLREHMCDDLDDTTSSMSASEAKMYGDLLRLSKTQTPGATDMKIGDDRLPKIEHLPIVVITRRAFDSCVRAGMRMCEQQVLGVANAMPSDEPLTYEAVDLITRMLRSIHMSLSLAENADTDSACCSMFTQRRHDERRLPDADPETVMVVQMLCVPPGCKIKDGRASMSNTVMLAILIDTMVGYYGDEWGDVMSAFGRHIDFAKIEEKHDEAVKKGYGIGVSIRSDGSIQSYSGTRRLLDLSKWDSDGLEVG